MHFPSEVEGGVPFSNIQPKPALTLQAARYTSGGSALALPPSRRPHTPGEATPVARRSLCSGQCPCAPFPCGGPGSLARPRIPGAVDSRFRRDVRCPALRHSGAAAPRSSRPAASPHGCGSAGPARPGPRLCAAARRSPCPPPEQLASAGSTVPPPGSDGTGRCPQPLPSPCRPRGRRREQTCGVRWAHRGASVGQHADSASQNQSTS